MPQRPQLNPSPGRRIRRCQARLEAREDFNPFLREEGEVRVRDLLGDSDDILSDILAAGALRGEKAGR